MLGYVPGQGLPDPRPVRLRGQLCRGIAAQGAGGLLGRAAEIAVTVDKFQNG